MLNNRDGTNEKPRLKVAPLGQGNSTNKGYSNSTTFTDSRSRYDKGMDLYREGKVKLGSNGLFKVSGYYEADTERMSCTCPDYRTRKEACKHIYAACLFVKNRGKQIIENLEGFNGIHRPIRNAIESTNKPQEAPSKEFNRQSTITRLAVINSAIEVLKTYRKPIEIQEVISFASQLETWALEK